MKYTVVIQWSEEDRCFVVFLPEFEDVMQPVTHGDSYEEAIYNAREVMELLIESCQAEGKPLPATMIYKEQRKVMRRQGLKELTQFLQEEGFYESGIHDIAQN